MFQWPGVSHHLLPTAEIARSVHVFYMFIRPVPPYVVLLPRMRKITEVELALVDSNCRHLVSVDLECHSTDSFNREATLLFMPYASGYTGPVQWDQCRGYFVLFLFIYFY